ncbi:hypothetical protein D3C79_804170 [compost metagenome]
MAVWDIGQQQALPRRHAQTAVTPFTRQLRSAAQHRRGQTAQRCSTADRAQVSLVLWINPQIAAASRCRATPLQDSCVATDRQTEPLDKIVRRMLDQQLTHTRLLWCSQVEKTIEHRQHQRMPLSQGHCPQR